MSELANLLEELAEAGPERGASAVFEAAVTRSASRRRLRRARYAVSAIAAAVAVALVIAGLARSSTSNSGVHVGPRGSQSTTTIPAATVAQLAAGRWSRLPAAPIVPRVGAAQVWTGSELIIWGGSPQTGRSNVVYGDGASYDPATNRWRRLPPAPLIARTGATAVWTGKEMIVWGGATAADLRVQATTLNPRVDPRQSAVAYDPSSNSWRSLGVVPLDPTPLPALGVWTGDRVVLLAGTSGASYDPTSGIWRALPAAPVHRLAGFRLRQDGWRVAVAAGAGRVLAWSQWEGAKPGGHGVVYATGGADVLRFDESSNTWKVLAGGASAISSPDSAFRVGGRVLVRGDRHIPGTLGPGPLPEVSDWYDPETGRATPLSSAPVGSKRQVLPPDTSVATGDALFSFAPGGVTRYERTDTRAYSLVSNASQLLPRAPFRCYQPGQPVWTGHEVLIYCPVGPYAGLAYVAGRPAG